MPVSKRTVSSYEMGKTYDLAASAAGAVGASTASDIPNTLMLREWMQHRRGWMVLVALPALIMLGIGLSGHMEIQFDGSESLNGPLPVAGALAAVCTLLTLFLAWGAALLQSPSLARRDVQDRSIEFWLSLPVGHVQSVGATVLTHLLLLPWAAIAFGLTAGLVTSLLVVASLFGPGAIVEVPWGLLLAAGVAAALRLALGVLLASLWLSPLILGTMAASAWLKRWGVPLVAGGLLIGGTLLERQIGRAHV